MNRSRLTGALAYRMPVDADAVKVAFESDVINYSFADTYLINDYD